MKTAVQTGAKNKLIRARADLVLGHPFFGHLALQLDLAEDPSCETAWTDGRTLAYNPLYINILPREKLAGLVGHLVMHPACRHHLRRNGREPKNWNMACDYAINWILLEAGLTLPDGYLDDPALRGKTADRIYARLMAEESGFRENVQEGGGDQNTEVEAFEVAVPKPAPDAGVPDRSRDPDSDGTEPVPAGVDADGQQEKKDASGQGDPGLSGEVRDAPDSSGGGDIEPAPAEADPWRLHLAQAASQARRMGDLPAGLKRVVDALLGPRLDWRQLLARFIQAAARADFSWTPPNRRYLHQGLYLPAMRSDDLSEVVVALDTSGSISTEELQGFGTELSAIMETCAATVHLLSCDARVARAETLGRQDLPLRLEPPGGGGTDFRPAFEWVAQQGISPLCMIYFTDMACNRFPPEPPYPVLWVCVGREGTTPPFGEIIRID